MLSRPPGPSALTQARDRFKLNLLTALPRLRAFLLGDFWVERLNFRVIAPVYVAFLALLFIGPQATSSRDHVRQRG